MIIRAGAILAVGMLCTACANQQISATSALHNPNLQSPTSAMASEAKAEARLLAKKTMAGKVLAALALERVTGRKPDPARFSEIH